MEHVQRNKMLLVDQESNCRLFNIDDGVVWWLIEGNKPLVYQYHQPAAKDYLTIFCGEDGTMDLYRHRKQTKEVVWCTKEKDIKVFLNTEYGEKLELVATSECYYLDGESGKIGEESSRNFLIVRKDYDIKFYSPTPYKTTVVWQLSFSRFKAYYPQSNSELKRAPIEVFHTTNESDFYQFCINFNLKDRSNTGLLENLKWKLPQNNESGIEMSEDRVGESKMVFGKFKGFEVAVEKLPRKGDLSKQAKNLRNLGVHENMMGFIKAERNGINDMFAYQITFIDTMKECIKETCYTTCLRTSWEWIKLLRGSINGLQFLHIHHLRHGNLKLHNLFVKDNYTVKLAGLANLEWPSDVERDGDFLGVDILDWGKLLLNMITCGRHGNEDGVPHDLEDILEKLKPEDAEVKDLLKKVLHKNYKERPSFEEILQHPVLCDWRSRIELLSELSDFCELKKRQEKDCGVHLVVHTLDEIVAPQIFTNNWKGKFDTKVLDEAIKHRTRDYDYTKLTDLLRLFRNIMSHHSEIKKFTKSLGVNKLEAELKFRRMFPNFFTEIRKVAKTHLEDKFRHHFATRDVDFKTAQTQILENPYA